MSIPTATTIECEVSFKDTTIRYKLSVNGKLKTFWIKYELPPIAKKQLAWTSLIGIDWWITPIMGSLLDIIAGIDTDYVDLRFTSKENISIPTVLWNFIRYLARQQRLALRNFHMLENKPVELLLMNADVILNDSYEIPTNPQNAYVGLFSSGKEATLSRLIMLKVEPKLPSAFFYMEQNTFAPRSKRFAKTTQALGPTCMVKTNLNTMGTFISSTEIPMLGRIQSTLYRVLELLPAIVSVNPKYIVAGNESNATDMMYAPNIDECHILHSVVTESALFTTHMSNILTKLAGEPIHMFSPVCMLTSFGVASTILQMSEDDGIPYFDNVSSCWYSTINKPWCGECLKCALVWSAFEKEGKLAECPFVLSKNGFPVVNSLAGTDNHLVVANLPYLPKKYRWRILNLLLRYKYPTGMLSHSLAGNRPFMP